MLSLGDMYIGIGSWEKAEEKRVSMREATI